LLFAFEHAVHTLSAVNLKKKVHLQNYCRSRRSEIWLLKCIMQ